MILAMSLKLFVASVNNRRPTSNHAAHPNSKKAREITSCACPFCFLLRRDTDLSCLKRQSCLNFPAFIHVLDTTSRCLYGALKKFEISSNSVRNTVGFSPRAIGFNLWKRRNKQPRRPTETTKKHANQYRVLFAFRPN